MKIIFNIIFVSIILFWNINSIFAKEKIIKKFQKKECIITNVDDGDTFDLVCSNNWKKQFINNVRTIWVNAPDIKNRSKHCYYDESKKVIEFIKNRKRKLEVEFFWKDLCKDPDKWCRNLVRIIDKNTGVDINKLLIYKWYNFSWTNFSMIPKRIKVDYFIAEKRARKNKQWLWNSCRVIYDDKYDYLNSSIPSKMTNKLN